MASPAPSGVSSPKPPQRKTLGDMIQELQKQIQSFGTGPHTPEQVKELEKLKVIYSRIKSEQERLINEARKQQAQQVQASGVVGSHQSQITVPTQVTQVIAPAGHVPTQPRIAPAPNLVPRTIVAQSTTQSPVSQVGQQTVQQVAHATTSVTILPQGLVQTTTIAQGSLQTSISQVTGQKTSLVPPQQVANIGQVHIGQAQAAGQVAIGQAHNIASIQQAVTQHLQVQPSSVVTMQSQPATAGPVKVSQAQPIMPQTTMKAHTPIHPHMASVTNPNAAAASGTTVMRTMADRVTLPSPTQTVGSSNQPVTAQRTLIPNKVTNLVPPGGSTTPSPVLTAPTGSVINKTLPAVASSGRITNYNASQGSATRPDTASPQPQQVLTKRRIQELLHEIDPREQMDEDVEDLLLQIADDFIESVVTASCQIAKHRKSSTLEVKDVQLHLERSWNMWIPGFGGDELRYKKAMSTEAHKQRMALIRKTMKK